jgi:uncharacterized membrane protein HdeD (DUF308 family)
MTDDTVQAGAGYTISRPGDFWGLALAYGVATLVLAVVLAVWPDETLKVLAVLIGIQLIITGVVRLISAVTARGVDGGVRAVLGLLGGLAVVVGLLCLRDPVQTVLVLSILLGVWWIASGFTDIISAFLSPTSAGRIWNVALGAISVGAGCFLLIHPDVSLKIFVIVACVWLFGTGLLSIAAAFVLRAERQAPRAAIGATGVAT